MHGLSRTFQDASGIIDVPGTFVAWCFLAADHAAEAAAVEQTNGSGCAGERTVGEQTNGSGCAGDSW